MFWEPVKMRVIRCYRNLQRDEQSGSHRMDETAEKKTCSKNPLTVCLNYISRKTTHLVSTLNAYFMVIYCHVVTYVKIVDGVNSTLMSFQSMRLFFGNEESVHDTLLLSLLSKKSSTSEDASILIAGGGRNELQ